MLDRIALATAVLVLLPTLWKLTRRPVGVAFAVVGLVAFGQFFSELRLPSLPIGAVNVGAEDALALFILWRALIEVRWNGMPRVSAGWLFGLFILVLLFLLSGLRGLGEGFDSQHVANASRILLLPICLLVYFTCIQPLRLDVPGLRTTAAWMVWLLAFVTMAKALAIAVGLLSIDTLLQPDSDVPRLISASPVMLLASLGVFLLLSKPDARERRHTRWALPVAFGLAIVMQHRSVWLALLVMVPIAMVVGNARSLLRMASLSVTLLCVFAFAAIGGYADRILSSMNSSAARALHQSDTVEWRYENWQVMLTPRFMGAPVNYVVGRPLGSSTDRTVHGYVVAVQAHNHYIQLFTMLGGLGLFCMVSMALTLAVRLMRQKEGRPWAVLLLGQLAYWVAYSPGPELMLLISLAYVVDRQARMSVPIKRSQPGNDATTLLDALPTAFSRS